MKILSLSASLTQASVCLTSEDFFEDRTHDEPKSHSEFVNVAIDQILKTRGVTFDEVDLVAVDHGPGSFTGIRVAVNIARSLCYLLKKPAVLFDSLDILAKSTTPVPSSKIVIAGVNAYRKQVYASLWNHQTQVWGPQTVTPAEIEARLNSEGMKISWVGDGFEAYRSNFSPAFQNRVSVLVPQSSMAKTLGLCALHAPPAIWTRDWKSILPLYLRESSAEENLRR